MISTKCSIEEFVEAVKDKDPQEVIALAVKEATKADRKVMKTRKQGKTEKLETYSRQLKRLINYHRYAVKPCFRIKKTYNLYMKYWGEDDPSNNISSLDFSGDTVTENIENQEIATRKHV